MSQLKEINLHQKKEIELHRKLVKHYQYRYGFEFSKLFQRFWNKQIMRMVPTETNIKILDLGCGPGLLLSELADKCNFVIGLDLSNEMLRDIKNGRNSVKGLVNATGNCLPFLENSFDVVVCRASLHHIKFLDQVLTEIKRVLKRKGLLILSEPSNDCFLIRVARKLMYRVSDRFDEEDKAFLTNELRFSLRDNGFNIMEEYRFGFLSYLFCGFPDHFSLMRYLPVNVRLTALLIKIDSFLSTVPFIKDQSFHIIVKSEKE